jgi:secreted trypsin-like serine protease
MSLKKAAFCVSMLLTATALQAADAPNTPSKGKRIVGGEAAEQDAWPWIASLVYTYEDQVGSLVVDGDEYQTAVFTNSPGGDVSGDLVDCGIGDATCAEVTDKICLIERGEINFSEKAANCEAGGGLGAVIYNNVEGMIYGTLGDDFEGTIPVVAVTQADGETLKAKLNTTANIEVAATAEVVQSSTCGGSFLGDRWVLTAAHCVDSPDAVYMQVNVGEWDLSDGAENAIDIKNIYMHGDYDSISLVNDIAIIELAESVDNAAVMLASSSAITQAATDNAVATVIGWGGRTGYEPGEGPTSDFPDILHQVDLGLMTNQECGETMAQADADRYNVETSADDYTPPASNICAGTISGGTGSCQGDSGGPLVIDNYGVYEQVGVVSWGIGCAVQGYPGVYTRVSEFQNWISAITQGIAVEQNLDFGVIPQTEAVTKMVTVTNNSELEVNLTYSTDNDSFSVDPTGCETLAAGASCDLSVIFNSDDLLQYTNHLLISADNEAVQASSTTLTGRIADKADDLAGEFDANNNLRWFSVGEAIWEANPEGGVQSGAIEDLQESVLMVAVEGEGTLTFDWAVSSEENVDDPTEPYDALYLYING